MPAPERLFKPICWKILIRGHVCCCCILSDHIFRCRSFSHEGLLPPNCPGLASLPVHGKVPRLQNTCAGCNTSFSTNSDLEQHASSSGHTAFSCTCGKQFSRAYTLTRHINSTIGLSFTCELCDDKAFTRLDKLSDHLRRWHRLGTKALDQYKGGNSPPSLASRPPGGIPPLTSEAPGRAYPVGPEVDPMSMLNGFNSATNTALGALSIHTSAGPEGSAVSTQDPQN